MEKLHFLILLLGMGLIFLFRQEGKHPIVFV